MAEARKVIETAYGAWQKSCKPEEGSSSDMTPSSSSPNGKKRTRGSMESAGGDTSTNDEGHTDTSANASPSKRGRPSKPSEESCVYISLIIKGVALYT